MLTNSHVGSCWLTCETGEGIGLPNSAIRSGDLDDAESREEENWCIWDVVLEVSDECVMDCEKTNVWVL